MPALPCAAQEPATSAAAPPEKKARKPKADKDERAGPSWEKPKGQSNGSSLPAPPPAVPKPDAPPAPGPEVFRVAAILKKRANKKGEIEYLIQWDGYGEDHNSWEPKATILDTGLIRAFEASFEPELPPEKKKRPAKQPSDGGGYRSPGAASSSAGAPSSSKGAGSSSGKGASKGAGKGAGSGQGSTSKGASKGKGGGGKGGGGSEGPSSSKAYGKQVAKGGGGGSKAGEMGLLDGGDLVRRVV